MMNIIATAPTRVDLAGGTLDLWPVQHLLEHKATVNFGITLNATVTINESKTGRFHITSQDQNLAIEGSLASITENTDLPLVSLVLSAIWHDKLPALTITTSAKSPAGAGLGGSSCLAVTIAGALLAKKREYENTPDKTHHELVQLAQDIEAKLIHAPTGCQDYWGALRGRINILRFPFGGTAVTTLEPQALPGLTESLILCYCGKSRASALNNWGVFKHVFDGDLHLKARLEDIGRIAEDCAQAVESGNFPRALELSQQEWAIRTQLWPSIETTETRKLDEAARQAGAQLTRVCGAGGGGVMAIFADPDRHIKVKDALIKNGGVILDAQVAASGLDISS